MMQKRGKNMKWPVIGLLAAAVIMVCVARGGCMNIIGKKEYVVGKDIANEEIKEFYYTYSTSTFPPEYQRYRFYVENGKYMLFHQTREGQHWPLTEEDATVTGTIELSQHQWQQFIGYLNNGKVVKRVDAVTDGNDTFLFLYWNSDKGKFTQFTFNPYTKIHEFVKFCEELVEKH